MQLTKPGLREQLKAKRLALSAAERQAKSRIIVNKLGEVVDWSQFKTVHTFEPLTKFAEVDISGFRPDAEIFYSKKINGEWQNVAHKQNTAIPEKFDIIIVPMLGFDKTLHRIGYGGGFYDKFLATQPEAKKIGVCFEVGRLDELPVEPHDIKMDIILTETDQYIN